MKDLPLSNLENAFILAALGESRRMDGRAPYDVRNLMLNFGRDYGCAQVTLGDTRVMAQVSCKMNVPKDARPAEGLMKINVELSPMAAPEFEANRPNSDFHVEISRVLERLIKESKCVDLEALCVISGEKVWDICVDVHVLNHQGNLIDAASVAAMAALLHFRRPDVTVAGNDVTVHSFDDKDPIPLSVHHIPICTTFAFMEGGKQMVVDPTDIEEKTMDGKVIVGMNVHQEICCLQMAGKLLLEKEQVIRCTNIALVKVNEVTQQIKTRLAEDADRRTKGLSVGFAADMRRQKTKLTVEKDTLSLDIKQARKEVEEMMEAWERYGKEEESEEEDSGEQDEEEESDEEGSETDSSSEEEETSPAAGPTASSSSVVKAAPSAVQAALTGGLGSGSQIGEGGPSQWTVEPTSMKEEGEESDSEEEEIVQLTTSEMT